MWIICVVVSMKTYFEYRICFCGIDIKNSFYMFFSLGIISSDLYFVIITLAFGVSAATFNLSLVVRFIQLHGNDCLLRTIILNHLN